MMPQGVFVAEYTNMTTGVCAGQDNKGTMSQLLIVYTSPEHRATYGGETVNTPEPGLISGDVMFLFSGPPNKTFSGIPMV